jgi:DNA polymerase-3 subunit epsilon
MKLLFFDTETTGIRPGSICQLSYIIVDSSKKPQTTIGKNFFFAVDYVEPDAERIHGFSAEKLYELSNGLYFEDLVEEFFEDFQNADFIIGHNVQFDIKFLKHELSGMGEAYEPKNVFCTMNYNRNICKILKPNGEYKNPKLEELIKFLNIDKLKISQTADNLFQGSGNYHDARFDTAATYLSVIEGIKQGYIAPGYFTNILNNRN